MELLDDCVVVVLLLAELPDDWLLALVPALLVEVRLLVLDWPPLALDAPEVAAEALLLAAFVVFPLLPLEGPVPVVEAVTVEPL